MNYQAPYTVLMIRPSSFGFNTQTRDSNAFQKPVNEHNASSIPARAIREFDRMARTLKGEGVNVIIINDSPLPVKPDSVFVNNWITFHHDGTIVLYPMQAENRRPERRLDLLNLLQKKYHYDIKKIIDLTGFENERKFLEGTGSIVFDYMNKKAYACLSPRTDESLVNLLCREIGFKPVIFNATDDSGTPVYHTNVILCIASRFALVCLDSIRDPRQRRMLSDTFKKSKLSVIKITMDQMERFSGNMIELKGNRKKNIIVMSKTAHSVLTKKQLKDLSKYVTPVAVDIPLIEKIGGGSARCMIAGVFNPEIKI